MENEREIWIIYAYTINHATIVNANEKFYWDFYRCNVTDKEEILKVAEKVREAVGDVTILINNTGKIYI